MPTYDYKCRECAHTFAVVQSMTEKAKVDCPDCGKKSLVRLIGAGAGIIFKGSGFYETDYKKKNGKASKSAPTPCESAASCPNQKECPAAKQESSSSKS